MNSSRRSILSSVVLSVAILAAATSVAGPPTRSFCNVPDLGSGTGKWPPVGCSYISPQEVFQIIDGLPPGTTIEAAPLFYGLVCDTTLCESPGGFLGGTSTNFYGTLQLFLTGTGDLNGFERTIEVPVVSQVHAAPRTAGSTVQTFATDYYAMEGSFYGDPDFNQLLIKAGTSYGFPSPGFVTMRQRPGGAYSVDSFFDLYYEIDFVGAPGGDLDGLSGSTVATIRLTVERPPLPVGACEAANNGLDTADLPPMDCTYLNPEEKMMIIDGLPPGSTMELSLEQSNFECDNTPCGQFGGSLGGQYEDFDSQITVAVKGIGGLAGYSRTLTLQAEETTYSGARTPGDPIQHFQTLVSTLSASLSGDPDFDTLLITAGDASGLPSPGMTTLGEAPDGSYEVDSFFDLSYQIEFVGAPGSVLEGLSGSTSGAVGMIAGIPEIFADGFESGNTTEW